MPQLTIITPVAGYHYDIAQRAVDSVSAQTLTCEHIVIRDTESQGAGWARNRGLEQVTTKYVTFLDADDTIDPRFAELCLGILDQYHQTHDDPRYVYTDWYGAHNTVQVAPEPCEAWTNQTSHLVTTVMPTERARLIGGFDDMMPGVEDADFYVRLRLSGVCGIHVNAPLVSYREGGQRSIMARATGQETLAQQYMTERYGRISMMGCCGDSTPGPMMPDGEPNAGDVLVQAQWGGNRTERGRATGKLYPRTSYPKMLYVNEADANLSPHLFRRVSEPVQASNGVVLQPQYQPVANWQDTMNAIFGGGQPQPMSAPVEYKPHVAGKKKASVVAQAQEWTKVEGNLE